MENEYEEPEENQEEQQQEAVEIYSKRAIFWFCLLFNPIFGGALLMQNLRDVGYKREANKVIVFSVLYFFIPQLILKPFNLNILTFFLVVLGLNIGAGFILTEYFFTKYFPDNDYYPKNILQVLLKCMLIIMVLIILAAYLVPMTGQK